MKSNILSNDVFLLSSGMCSDYSVDGQFRALQDFEVSEAWGVWTNEMRAAGEDTTRYARSNREFVEWLLSSGRIERIPIREIYTGDYGELNLEER